MRGRIYLAVAAIAIAGTVYLAPPAGAAGYQIKIKGDGALEGAALTGTTDVYLDLASPGQVEFVRWILKNGSGTVLDRARDNTAPFEYRITDRRDGRYVLAADLAVIGNNPPRAKSSFTFGPPPPPHKAPQVHLAGNCNIIGHRGGEDHRICIMVDRHDLWLWRSALADVCSATNGADYLWLDRIWLERNGNTVRSNSNRRWAPICGRDRDSFATDWDEFCSPGPQPRWQAHMRFALHWKGGGQTNLLEIHSGVDSGLC